VIDIEKDCSLGMLEIKKSSVSPGDSITEDPILTAQLFDMEPRIKPVAHEAFFLHGAQLLDLER
jgi:hypothetical protein